MTDHDLSKLITRRGRDTGSLITVKARKAAVKHVAEHGYNPGEVAEICGLSVSALKRLLDGDPIFRDELEVARLKFVTILEAEAFRRAIDGWDEPRIGPGGVQYNVRRFSEGLLVKLLDANAPEKYGNKVRVEHSTKVTVEAIGFDSLPTEAKLKMLEFLDVAAPPKQIEATDAEYSLSDPETPPTETDA